MPDSTQLPPFWMSFLTWFFSEPANSAARAERDGYEAMAIRSEIERLLAESVGQEHLNRLRTSWRDNREDFAPQIAGLARHLAAGDVTTRAFETLQRAYENAVRSHRNLTQSARDQERTGPDQERDGRSSDSADKRSAASLEETGEKTIGDIQAGIVNVAGHMSFESLFLQASEKRAEKEEGSSGAERNTQGS